MMNVDGDRYDTDGYLVLEQLFPGSFVDAFERHIIALYHMLARKIGEYRERADAIMDSGDSNHARIGALLAMMEATDKDAAYQVQRMLPRSQPLRSFFGPGFMRASAHLIGANPDTILLDGPALFVNMPTVERLLYKWHSEALYYPKRRRFVNVWMPLFSPRTAENGAMAILPGSHKRVWDASLMSEYTGYNKDSEGKKNHFVQYEIPEAFLTGYGEPKICATVPGDVVLFDRNLIHSSRPNLSGETAFAVVCRVWSPEDDLTLSGDMEVTPYRGGNLGRANLVVRT